MSLSVLLKQCPACLVRLIWIVLWMGGRWSYSCCFVECCFQDMARSILVQLPYCFFSIFLVSVHIVHPYSSIDTTAAWKTLLIFIQLHSFYKYTSNIHKSTLLLFIEIHFLYSYKYTSYIKSKSKVRDPSRG